VNIMLEGESSVSANSDKTYVTGFVVRFRNYTPFDENLSKFKRERPHIVDVIKEIDDRLQKIAQEQPDWDTVNIAPKKINWDLKRDVQSRLEKLELRTQRAIIEMMKETLLKQEEKLKGTSRTDDLNREIAMDIVNDIEEDSEE